MSPPCLEIDGTVRLAVVRHCRGSLLTTAIGGYGCARPSSRVAIVLNCEPLRMRYVTDATAMRSISRNDGPSRRLGLSYRRRDISSRQRRRVDASAEKRGK